MDRRLLLTGAAVFAAASPVFAQTAGPAPGGHVKEHIIMLQTISGEIKKG